MENQPTDIGIVLAELLSNVGDVLSYYQNLVATEGYLPTARLLKLKEFFMPLRILIEGEPGSLQDLMSLIDNMIKTLENDIEALYENWFIESPDEWVEPNINDLVSAICPLLHIGGCLLQRVLNTFQGNSAISSGFIENEFMKQTETKI